MQDHKKPRVAQRSASSRCLESLKFKIPSVNSSITGSIRQSIQSLKLKDELIFVTKWVDNYGHSGFCYKLSDDTTGVLFKDSTTIVEQGMHQKFLSASGKLTDVSGPPKNEDIYNAKK